MSEEDFTRTANFINNFAEKFRDIPDLDEDDEEVDDLLANMADILETHLKTYHRKCKHDNIRVIDILNIIKSYPDPYWYTYKNIRQLCIDTAECLALYES